MSSSNSYSYYLVIPKFRHFIIILLLSLFIIYHGLSGRVFAEEPFYSIQLDTFNNLENAKERVAELKGLGYNSFFRTETLEGDKGEVYKVYIERYESRSDAENEAKVLKELELISDYLVVEIREEKVKEKEGVKEEVKKEPKEAVEKKAQQPKPEPVKEEIKDDSYLIQVGSFREKENVENMLQKLKDSGHSAFYRQEEVKGKGEMYRLYIKGFQSKAEAQKTGNELIESSLISDYILKAPEGKEAQTVTKTEEDTNKSFFLHVASFKEEENAEQSVQFLTDNGLKAFHVAEEISGNRWFRVYIGNFDDEASARKAGSELLEKGIISYFKPIEINRGESSR